VVGHNLSLCELASRFSLDSAEEKAGRFLKSAQRSDGMWEDFATHRSGSSTCWVTAYLGSLLDASGHGLYRRHVHSARAALLRSRHSDGGWGYQPAVPSDADSTSFAVLTLLGDSRHRDELDGAVAFLLKHEDASRGGFRTYWSPEVLQKYRPSATAETFRGWCSSHLSVTAAAVRALLNAGLSSLEAAIERALRYIMDHRNANGCWNCYWWIDHYYPTYQALSAIARFPEVFRSVYPGALAWLVKAQCNEGGWSTSVDGKQCAFSTALAVRSLLLSDEPRYRGAIAKGLRWLVTSQSADGSWHSVPILRIPPPRLMDPTHYREWRVDDKGVGAYIRDQNRLFTSATVWAAIFDALERSH